MKTLSAPKGVCPLPPVMGGREGFFIKMLRKAAPPPFMFRPGSYVS